MPIPFVLRPSTALSIMPNPSIAYPLPNPVRRRPSRTRSLPIQYALASISETSEHDEEHRTNITEFSPKLGTSEVSLLPGAAAEGNVAPLNEQAAQTQLKSVPRRCRKALKIQTTKVDWIDSDRDCGIWSVHVHRLNDYHLNISPPKLWLYRSTLSNEMLPKIILRRAPE